MWPRSHRAAQTNSLGGNRGGIPRGSHLKTADDLFDSQTSSRTESMVLSLRFSGLTRHYFRYSALFHDSYYNLISTTTKLPLRGG